MTLKSYEDVNHLVLNFYPDGYSIAVKLNEFPVFTSETILETARISYKESSLLDYIENEELPPLLVEMIDSSPKLSQYKIWHNGCLILEIRDRIGHSTGDEGFFIMLKPTNLSMLYDVLNLTDSMRWSTLDRLELESQIVLHNSPLLSLELDSRKSSIERPKRRKLPHTRLKNPAQKHMEDLEPSATNGLPPQLALQQFISTKKAKRTSLANEPKPKYCRFKTKRTKG